MSDYSEKAVQWYPGHMAKTKRRISERLSMVDAAVIILDARLPAASSDPTSGDLLRGKPVLYLLNKCSLADPAVTARWREHFAGEGSAALAVDCVTGEGLNRFRPAVGELLAPLIERNNARGLNKELRLLVMGVPNCGKSTFINKITKRKRAKAEDRAGVTRDISWFIGEGFRFMDTPGVLWPKFDDPEVGYKLAYVGSIRDDVLDVEDVASSLCAALARSYPEALDARYGIGGVEGMQGWEILELIGKKRGMLMRGGVIDTERASRILLDEFRAGKLGRISLETPEEV